MYGLERAKMLSAGINNPGEWLADNKKWTNKWAMKRFQAIWIILSIFSYILSKKYNSKSEISWRKAYILWKNLLRNIHMQTIFLAPGWE